MKQTDLHRMHRRVCCVPLCHVHSLSYRRAQHAPCIPVIHTELQVPSVPVVSPDDGHVVARNM